MKFQEFCLCIALIGASSAAMAKDSWWECTNPDGSVEESVLKCEKGQKSKLIVLDSPPSRYGDNVTSALPSPTQDRTNSASAACYKPPAFCEKLVSHQTAAQRTECSVALEKYRNCFPKSLTYATCDRPPPYCDKPVGQMAISENIECQAYTVLYGECLIRK